jgi:hypothetical protein
MSTDYKNGSVNGDKIEAEIVNYEDALPDDTFSNEPEVKKRLLRKLDSRLMVWAFFGYFANGLDRNNMRKFFQEIIKFYSKAF